MIRKRSYATLAGVKKHFDTLARFSDAEILDLCEAVSQRIDNYLGQSLIPTYNGDTLVLHPVTELSVANVSFTPIAGVIGGLFADGDTQIYIDGESQILSGVNKADTAPTIGTQSEAKRVIFPADIVNVANTETVKQIRRVIQGGKASIAVDDGGAVISENALGLRPFDTNTLALLAPYVKISAFI